jgi:hypothetical protein
LPQLDFGERGIEMVHIHDNSEFHEGVRQGLSFGRGRPRLIAAEIPSWRESVFSGSKFEIAALGEAAKDWPRKR